MTVETRLMTLGSQNALRKVWPLSLPVKRGWNKKTIIFEFAATTDVDSRRKCFPDHGPTDFGCYEEIEARAETISILEQRITMSAARMS